MMMSDDFERRLLELEKKPSPTRSQVRTRLVWLLPLAFAGMALVFVRYGGFANASPREWTMGVGMVGGCLALAVLATVVALSRGKSMLGASTRALWAIAVGVPVAMALWTMVWHWLGYLDPFERPLGLRCFGMTLLAAPWPFVAIVMSRKLLDPVHPGLTGAAMGSVAGAWASVMVTLWCPLADANHVLRGHLLPFALIVPSAAFLGRRIFGAK